MLRRFLQFGLLACLLATVGCSRETNAADKTETPSAQPVAADPSQSAATTTERDKPAGEVYGDGIQQSDVVAISKLMENPEAYAGKTVRVEGTVTDVCPKRGCWFEMAGERPGDKMRFKVQDGVMVFPMDAKGKHAVAEGVVVTQTLSLEDTRKYFEYQAKEYGKDVDPASITEPMTIVRLDGKGAVIRDAK